MESFDQCTYRIFFVCLHMPIFPFLLLLTDPTSTAEGQRVPAVVCSIVLFESQIRVRQLVAHHGFLCIGNLNSASKSKVRLLEHRLTTDRPLASLIGRYPPLHLNERWIRATVISYLPLGT